MAGRLPEQKETIRLKLTNPVTRSILQGQALNAPLMVLLPEDACYICGVPPSLMFSVQNCCNMIACFTCVMNFVNTTAVAEHSNGMICPCCKNELLHIRPSPILALSQSQRQQAFGAGNQVINVRDTIAKRRREYESSPVEIRGRCKHFLQLYRSTQIVRDNATGRKRLASFVKAYGGIALRPVVVDPNPANPQEMDVFVQPKTTAHVPVAPWGPSKENEDRSASVDADRSASVDADRSASVDADRSASVDADSYQQ